MSELGVCKRAWLSCTRKPTRSLLLLVIMIVVFTSLVAQSGIRSTMQGVQQAINANVNAGFTARADNGSMTLADAQRLATLPGITRYCFEAEALAKPQGASLVSSASGIQLDPEFAGDMGVIGTTDSALHPAFQGRLYTLEEGEHAREGRLGALVHRDFCVENGLGLGSMIVLSRGSTRIELPIVGVFSGKNENPSGLPSGASENQVFTDLESAQTLARIQTSSESAQGDEMPHVRTAADGQGDDTPLRSDVANDQNSAVPTVDTARYFTANANQLAATLQAAQDAAGGMDGGIALEDNAAQFAGVLKALSSVDKLLTTLLVGVCAAGVLVLGLVLVFWVRGRVHEIGILLALGKTKANMLAQLAIEMCGIGLVAAACATAIGQALSRALGELVLVKAGDEALAALSVNAPDAAGIAATLLVGFLVAGIALALAVVPTFRQTPRAILSKMS